MTKKQKAKEYREQMKVARTDNGLPQRQKAKRPWWTTVKDPECERYNRPPDARIEFK